MDKDTSVDNPVNNTVEQSVDKAASLENEHMRLAAQKKRSKWLALLLFGFVILVGTTSALQLKENIQRNSSNNTQQIAEP